MRVAHLGELRSFVEAWPGRQSDEMLDQHVQRQSQWAPCFDALLVCSEPSRSDLNHLPRMRWHAQDATGLAGAMPASARPLHQPADAFGTAHLNHLVDSGEVDAEIQRRRANHAPQLTALEPLLDPRSKLSIDGAVVERNRSEPIEPRLDDVPIPDLGLRAGVRE